MYNSSISTARAVAERGGTTFIATPCRISGKTYLYIDIDTDRDIDRKKDEYIYIYICIYIYIHIYCVYAYAITRKYLRRALSLSETERLRVNPCLLFSLFFW